nr:tegument protein UL14 [Mastomys natalensis cytomegalovirus 3]WEG69922.1 tegument protein UL14 [Mastomys natalensis cytomegalovirus 3]WEG70062.1 tegument protein UL14 [Mastomys natalensis cytomegalovirus 3]WEG70202.1 tegument protein UL14 [Mastomys natalensis cytomegalovirus 3]WEG70342.1 tegument protein UL14 [Mastomys natalensis cytomegalovirus 3]
MSDSKIDVLKDAMRYGLETQQTRFFMQTFGENHPLVRIQGIKAADARTKLMIREGRRTAQDVTAAILARKTEIDELSKRTRIAKDVDGLVDAVMEMKDVVSDFRETFTSSVDDDV